jgi:glycine C-acetyltransferase
MFDMMTETNELQQRLHENTSYFKEKIIQCGFKIRPSQSAIIAIMLYDAKLSQDFANDLLKEGIYVVGFYYPVVPQGQARIRVQLSAAHSKEQLGQAINAFQKIGRKYKVIP